MVIGERVHHDDGSIGLPKVIAPSQPTGGLNELADIIQRGNRDLQVGSALDSGLFAKSQQLLAQSNGWPVPGNDPVSDRPRWYHQLVDPTLQNMFNAVNSDDMVIHDAITGPGGERFRDNLTRHQWQDDGLAAGGCSIGSGDSAAHDWTGRAAATAHALAEYTSNHSNQLLNLAETQGQSLGQVNPEPTRDWANPAFSPYMDDMVGDNVGGNDADFLLLDLDGSVERTNTRHLSVLYSDEEAARIMTEQVTDNINRYLDSAAHSAVERIQWRLRKPDRVKPA